MKNIWTLIFGIFMIIGGLYALFNPLSTLLAFSLYLGIIFVAMGFGYFITYKEIKSSSILVIGIIDILVGILFIMNLGITATTLPFILAFWALFAGIMQILLSFQFKSEDIPTWSWRLSTGILGIILGLMMLIFPVLGILAITILIGSSLIIFGAFEVIEYIQNQSLESS